MINTLIVEDEPLAAERLKVLLGEMDSEIQIKGRTQSIEETITFLNNEEVDLMFLDINLSDGNSFEIFERIANKTPIVFTTAYSEFAIKAFERNSVSYLLKPIKREELAMALNKFKEYHLSTEKETIKNAPLSFLQNQMSFKERFVVKHNNRLETINVKDICYFFVEDKVTFCMLESGKRFYLDMNLKELENKLDPLNFFRANRKYLINLKSIGQMYYVSQSRIKLELVPKNTNDPNPILVAIEKIGKFKRWLDGEV
ncbi:LytTR family DNA-binding domain-containing protein [Flagellimonas sp. HMM57]|uniref:LytR/AlgR family response regulator transcription factor n=1 Tax=unclassified Flagellimonas TaxID=2644544 RepID=UPI0013CF6F03|nr:MULTISPECIES: LytTR family DNA-binding domain-containing protein [unclassified Flagellimonas]UII77754.1 LytTR family DNA-binding domain-containing protein [Flagellimonas sp. HMM57]